MQLSDKIRLLRESGAKGAAIIPTDRVPFDPDLRQYCNPNTCQVYGKNWGCPPAVGDIQVLIDKAKKFTHTLVYQTVTELDDPFDYEGMLTAGKHHKAVTDTIIPIIREWSDGNCIHLSAGGCSICERCTKLDEQPCRYPELALHSVSAYGIYVSGLADICGLPYNNGENTITLFSVVFLNL